MNQHGRNHSPRFVSRQQVTAMKKTSRLRSWGICVGHEVADNLCLVLSANGATAAYAVPVTGSDVSYEVYEAGEMPIA